MVMATSFKRTYASAVVFRAPDPTAGHCRPMPLPETPGHAQASLVQSVVGSLLLSPGSWCTRGFVCALQESLFPQSCGSSVIKSHWPSKSNSLGILSLFCQIPKLGSLLYREPCPWGSPLLTHTSTGDAPNIVLSQSLWGSCVLVCTRYV